MNCNEGDSLIAEHKGNNKTLQQLQITNQKNKKEKKIA